MRHRPAIGGRSAVFAGLLAGGLLGLVASAQPWWRATGEGADVPFTGTGSTAGLSQALVVVALAGTVLMLSLRTRGKQVLAVLLALTGSGIVLTGLLRPRPSGTAVRTKLREISLIDQYSLVSTAWPYVYAVAGVVIFAAAVTTLLRAPQWPQRAARFERDTGTPAVVDTSDPAVWWKAMDAGVDPTLDPAQSEQASIEPRPGGRADRPGSEVPGAVDAPDVHENDAGDRMGTKQHKDGRPDAK
jgi:uncharacterized membrane protein (TIGR02234 family)